jgi:hypothetical protein
MSNLINSSAFNDIDFNSKRQFYKDLGYIDNEHDFCSDRSTICRGADVRTIFERISGKGDGVTSKITEISHSKCEDEDAIFNTMLDAYSDRSILEHIKNLIYEQSMNSLDLPNGPHDKKAWETSLNDKEHQPVHIHIVFSKLNIDGHSAFSKETRLLIMSIFANSLNNFGELKTNQSTFSAPALTKLSKSKVYSIDASCINFTELLNAHDLDTKDSLKFVHLNDGATKFDSATKLMPSVSMKEISFAPNGIVDLISANISPLIIKRTTDVDINWKKLFNRFSYCLISMSSPSPSKATSATIYPFKWEIDTSILTKYQTYMLVDPECFMYSVSVQTASGSFLPGEKDGYTLILKGDKGILIKTEGKETDGKGGKDDNRTVIGSISVASLTQIYTYNKKSKSDKDPVKSVYASFEEMITYILGTSSLALSIQKILLDFKRCGDQLAVMSLKQLNDLSQNKVAFVSLDRLAYMYAKMLGVCTSVRVGVAGAYFEEPDGDDKPDGIEYINESGHNYNLWFHRTEVAKELDEATIFDRTIERSKNMLGEISQYIIERFGPNRTTILNTLLVNLKRFTSLSELYIAAKYGPDTMFGIVNNLIILFTLLINLNIYYISLLLSKIDILSVYFSGMHNIAEKVEFKSQLEQLEELYKKLKKSYSELPNNLIEKINDKLDKYFVEITKTDRLGRSTVMDPHILTYKSFQLILETTMNVLKGDSMEANYGVLLHKLIFDGDITLPSLKDYTVYDPELPARHRKGIRYSIEATCTHVLNSIKIIATSVYGTVFKNIDKYLSNADEERLKYITDLKESILGANDTDTRFIFNINAIIRTIIEHIQNKLQPTKTLININEVLCVSQYDNNYIDKPALEVTQQPEPIRIKIDASKVVIPEQDIHVDITDIIKLAIDSSKTEDIIKDMNTFILMYDTTNTEVPPRIKGFVETLGKIMTDFNAVNSDLSINKLIFETKQCKDIHTIRRNLNEQSALCTITTLNLVEAFSDSEYLDKIDEFVRNVEFSINSNIKNHLIAYAIINKLLKVSGNKYMNLVDMAGGAGLGGKIDKFKFKSSYILNSEYVLSLSLIKNFFSEFNWKNRLIIAKQFLDSTSRFYKETEFTHTIHLINMARKECNFILDTHDLVSYKPLNGIFENKINPAMNQILQLYLKEIYLPSFTTVKKIAVSLFPANIMNTLTNVELPNDINLDENTSSKSKSRSSSSKSTSKSRSSSSKSTSKSRSSSGRITISNSVVENDGLLSALDSIPLNIIDSTNSIQESIERRIEIINQPDKYNLEKLYITFTTDIYTCGEIATAYIDEQFCKIPEYKEMVQTSYTAQLKTQTLVPATPNIHYSLIPFQLEPDEKQSFIMKKSINTEHVYNLINLFKSFRYNNPLDIDGEYSSTTDDTRLQMFSITNIHTLTQLGKLIGPNMKVKDALEKIASFVYKVQSMIIEHYKKLESISSNKLSLRLPGNTRRTVSPVSGGSSLNPSTKSSSKSRSSRSSRSSSSKSRRGNRSNQLSNRFVLITPKLKLFVMTVEIYTESTDGTSSSNLIIQPNETSLSDIDFENTIEIKECLLRLTDVFKGMIYDNIIPPYKIETTEIYDFTPLKI